MRFRHTRGWLGAVGLAATCLAAWGCAASSTGARATPSQPGAPSQNSAERPTYSVGDRWIRSDGLHEVLRVDRDRYVFSAGPDAEYEMSRDLVPLKLHGMEWRFSTPAVLDWPLRVGKSGTLTGEIVYRTRDTYPMQLSWRIESREEIEVPAGRFAAFRILFGVTPIVATNFSSRASTYGAPPAPWLYRLWYAPSVRQIVKAERTGGPLGLDFEVVAVDPTETAPLHIGLREPQDGAVVHREVAQISGLASGGQGVGSVQISLNGAPVASPPVGRSKRTVILDTSLTLRPGRNVILVTVADPSGTTAQAARTIHYEPPERVPLPPPGVAARAST